MANVTVYSTQTCPYCTMAKNFLAQNKVAFNDVDVSRDHRAAMEMIRKSGQQGVPVIDINGSIIVGFDRSRMSSLLGLN